MKGLCSFTPVLAIVGLVGLGVGGYNMLRSGCPLGTCDQAQPAAAVTAVSTDSAPKEPCCPLSGSAQRAESADVKTVAHTETTGCTEAKECSTASACSESEACCKGKEASECCKAKNAGHCPDSAASAEGKAECPFTGNGEGQN